MVVMDNWNKKKFVVSESFYEDGFSHIVVLSDLSFWHNNFDELGEWCQQYGAEILGMTVNIPNEEILTLFYLRWI